MIPTSTGPIVYTTNPAAARANSYSDRMIASSPRFTKRHSDVKLQRAAIKAWRKAERLLGRRLGKGPWKFRRSRAIPTTGTWRGYDVQAALYASDPRRYAKPWISGHPQGIAADVSTDFVHFDLAIECLEVVGWRRTRPTGEPWHVTWGVTV